MDRCSAEEVRQCWDCKVSPIFLSSDCSVMENGSRTGHIEKKTKE